MKVYIYALCEPGTRSVRYIGRSKHLKKRLQNHLSSARRGLDSPLGEWLRSLSDKPNMVSLCETSEAFWQDDEKTYIRAARALGMPLLNSSDGGEGIINPTPETRAKQGSSTRGTKHSPERRRAMSLRMMGKNNPRFGYRECYVDDPKKDEKLARKGTIAAEYLASHDAKAT